MMPTNTPTTLSTAIIAIIVTVTLTVALCGVRRAASKTRKGVLPPGPPVRWFWDDAMPIVNIGPTLDGWANEYGPVMTLRQGGEIVIVIARVDAATAIMEKEGGALADRPRSVAAGELLSGGMRITLVGSGERFRRLRRAVHTHFQPRAVLTYGDIQLEEAKALVLNVLDDPDNHQSHARRFSTAVILRVTYGNPGSTYLDDPEFVGLEHIGEHFIEVMRPGAYLVDRFPWLKHVPGYGKRLRTYYRSDLAFYKSQLSRVEREMSSDDAGPSFSRTLLENVDDHQLSVDEMAFLSGTLFEAGSDTSADSIIAMIMAAACFPDAQSWVQEELDVIVGRDSLPSWTDWDDLPRLHAFISEVLRWRPVTPLGFAHRSTRDIVWNGYDIPAGTTVTGNLWAIGRDPVAFPDPERFEPRRWLDRDGRLRSDVACYPFGFGRRVCPGMHLANRSLFVALAFLLWSFRVVERPGSPIDMTPDTDNVVARVAHFVADFVPRIGDGQLREMMAAM